MEEYLKHKKVLCLLPAGRGHGFFLELAEKYRLDKAKEHIEGFYATLKGKVEVEEEGKRKPASGAKVTVTDSKDDRTWEATADKDGKYKLEKVILHKSCSPFQIEGKHEGDSVDDSYQGPLEQPDKSKEHEKNLLIQPAAWEGTIAYRWKTTAQKGQSLVTAIVPGGKYKATESWRLWVKFKRDRGNQNVEIFAVSSARLESFASDLEATAMDMQNKGRRIEIEVADSASARSRKLTPEECSLELILNLKKRTYTLHGLLSVENIDSRMESSLRLTNTPGNYRDSEAEGGKADIKENINLEGSLEAIPPVLLKGQKDLLAELPPEMKDFLQTMGGSIETWMSWNLRASEKK
jgi:polyhydroxyalkanoate synthesis regulator phasin